MEAPWRLRAVLAALQAALELVLHDCTVRAVNHENSFLDHDALDVISEDGEGIEAKMCQITKALGMDHARIAVGGQLKRLAVNQQRLFQFGKENFAPHGRLGGGHQQSVIAAGVQPGNGRRSESTETVGFQPLTSECGIQVAAGFFCKLNHNYSPPRETRQGLKSDSRARARPTIHVGPDVPVWAGERSSPVLATLMDPGPCHGPALARKP